MSEIEPEIGRAELFRVTAEIITAHVANNAVPASDVARLIGSVHQALSAAAQASAAAHVQRLPESAPPALEALPGATPEYEPPIVPMALPAPGELAADDVPEPVPMVPIDESVFPDRLVCLECGRGLQMLRVHLRKSHELSFEDYRRKWRLPRKYPAIAENYSAQRRHLSLEAGLGRKGLDARQAKAAALREPEAAPPPPPPPPPPEPEPAVAIADSVKPDKLFCLECGKPFKVLAMHLNQVHHLNPSVYRHKWGLPVDYPMMCAETAATYREQAKVRGLGTAVRGRKETPALEGVAPIGKARSALLRAVGGGR